jgi:PIN domain nuclease of toxin-antitoxin system
VNLLLDTHVLIWWDEGAKLAADARRAIETADTVYVSAASAWEVAIKTAIGRIRSSRTVEQAAQESGFLELPVTFRHAERVAVLRSSRPALHPQARPCVSLSRSIGVLAPPRSPAPAAYVN